MEFLHRQQMVPGDGWQENITWDHRQVVQVLDLCTWHCSKGLCVMMDLFLPALAHSVTVSHCGYCVAHTWKNHIKNKSYLKGRWTQELIFSFFSRDLFQR